MSKMKNVQITLPEDALNSKKIKRLKLTTTVAVIGIPVAIQVLGAMLYYGQINPVLLSPSAFIIFAVFALLIIACGLYVLSNRVFLHFLKRSNAIGEWDQKTQNESFAFAYRCMAKGMLIAFVAISALGAMQLFDAIGWIDFKFAQSLTLNLSAIAAFTVGLTYLILFLPTLYMAWTLRPLSQED